MRDHEVVGPGGVAVLCLLGKHPVAVALIPSPLADHAFLVVVIALLWGMVVLVFSLTLFQSI